MRSRSRRSWLHSTLLITSALIVSAAGPAGAASYDAAADITSSPDGRRLAEEAAARYTSAGVPTAASDLVVIDYGTSGLMIGPRGATIAGPGEVITATRPWSRQRTTTATMSTTRTAATPAAASTWELVSDLCFTRKAYGGGEHWIDACYHLRRLTNDGNGNYDYYGLRVFGTAHSPRLEQAWVESWRCCGAAQTWFDWDFKSDRATNCVNQTLGISAYGFGLSYGTTVCEQWDITKWAEAGHFKNRWHTWDGQWWVDGDRETEFLIGIKVPQGGWPQWYIGFDVDWW